MHAGDVVVASTLDSGHQPALNGRISVKKSKGVHVGHRIYYNAPVNVILPDNTLTLRPEQLNSVEQNFVDHTVLADKKGKFQLNKKRAIILAVAIVTVIVIVVIAVVLTRPKYTPDIDLPYKFVPRGEWFAKNGSEDIPFLKKQPVQYVIVSDTHSSYCSETKYCRNLVWKIQADNFEIGCKDIRYNFLIAGDGAAYEGRGWNKQSSLDSPLKTKNPLKSISLSIAFMGYFVSSPPPDHQIKTFETLIAEGIRLNKITMDYKIFVPRQVLGNQNPGTAFLEKIMTWKHWAAYDPKNIQPT